MSEKEDFVIRGRDGAPVDVSELRENPFDRRARSRSVLRALSGSRGLGAAALAVGVLVLGWKLRPTGPPAPAAPASTDGVTRLTSVDPPALRAQIVDELRAAGVQASGYEQLGVQGVDAQLPRPVPAAVSGVLEHHSVPMPGNGVLRIEITTPDSK